MQRENAWIRKRKSELMQILWNVLKGAEQEIRLCTRTKPYFGQNRYLVSNYNEYW